MMHTPVLLQETIEALEIKKGGKYIDATYGLGGHSREIVKKGGIVLGIDWDDSSETRNLKRETQKIKIVQGNYADIENIAQTYNFSPCEGIIFDLGLSMEQIRKSGRGFSYESAGEPLDMRIHTSLDVTAANIVNSFSTDELYEIFARNAEEVNSRPIAQAINNARHIKPIKTVGELIDAMKKVTARKESIARIFQALRIEVNNEYENIIHGLEGASHIMSKSGRIVIISFHPSEDRIIKRWVREHGLRMATKKPIVKPTGEKFERSAKLRVITH